MKYQYPLNFIRDIFYLEKININRLKKEEIKNLESSVKQLREFRKYISKTSKSVYDSYRKLIPD